MLGASALIGILSLIFKVGGKLRLTLPVLYFLAATVSTFFTDWTTKNEQLVLYGLYILIGLVALSWVGSLIKVIRKKQHERFIENDLAWQISRAREMGILKDGDSVQFNEGGDLLEPRTGKPVMFGDTIQFRDV